jgi:hypothetical protein
MHKRYRNKKIIKRMEKRISINNNSIQQNPSAWIVSSTDRGRKSIKKGNKVYLEDNQEFQIEMFNPLRESVLCDLKINGVKVSQGGLILRPGQRFYLDCFVDDKRKFVFKTYEVEDTEEVRSSIINNGLVEVFFYKEEVSINDWLNKINTNPYPTYPGYPTFPFNTPVYANGTTVNNVVGGCVNTLSDKTYYSGTVGNLENYRCKSIETGRVEKGDISSQEFVGVNMDFQNYHISSVVYQILPESQRPIETSELKKYCEHCGSKLK